MRVVTSQLAGGANNADRVLVTDNAVLVLDGATAFEPVPIEPGEYAETLGHEVARRLIFQPDAQLPDLVASSIESVAENLDLRPGRSPSSTISILRARADLVDLYVLGDSPIYYSIGTATQRLTDDRLANIGQSLRNRFIERLRAGYGYSGDHRETLAALQRVQRQLRNTSGGYWIAETDPAAAMHAITRTLKSSDARWAVLGTDGATNHIDAYCRELWPSIASYDQQQLDDLLDLIHKWEREADPDGYLRPRAKIHDDKTLAVVPHL